MFVGVPGVDGWGPRLTIEEVLDFSISYTNNGLKDMGISVVYRRKKPCRVTGDGHEVSSTRISKINDGWRD